MATESVTDCLIRKKDAERIRWMLLDAIMAKNELDRVLVNMEMGAKAGYTAKQMLAVRPQPVDLDIYELAEMVQILSVLPEGQEVMP